MIKNTLLEVLRKKKWDYVSIQQLSRLSFLPETYEPHAGQLIAYIREHSPESEIVIHMTWAYREDHDWFLSDERTQQEMYQGLAKAYQKIADSYGLEIIPIGAAMQRARQMKPWQFSFPDPDFNYESPTYPEVPDQPGSLNTGWRWRKNRQTGEMAFGKDANHANDIGCYLGGLVHFEFFFGRPVEKSTVFRLDELNDKQLDSLVKAAHRAIANYRPHNRQAAAPVPAQP